MTDEYAFAARTRVGFSDTDAQGIVYYGRYNPYFDLARVEYLRSLELLRYEGAGEFVMRANDVEYFAPARFDDELEITLEVERLGNTSMVSAIGIARDGDMLAEGRIVHIFVRAERLGEKAPIPDHVRRILQPYVVEDLDSHATSTITKS